MEKSQTNATNATIPPLKSQASNLTKHLNTHNGGKLNKCNQCDYASFQAVNLKKRLKTHSWEKSNKCNQWFLPGKRFEETFNDAQWRKVKQMQPMRLCLLSRKRFEETFKDAQWRKVKHTQLMRLCHVIWIYIWKHWRKVDKMQPMWLCFQADNLKKHSGGFLQPSQSLHTCPSVKCTNTTMQVYYNHLRPAILGGT